MMNALFLLVGITLVVLGVVMRANRAGYLTFIIRPSTIVLLAIVIAIFVLGARAAKAETNYAFILNSFPHCKSEPVFSHYSAGAVGAIEAKQRAGVIALAPVGLLS
jgi:hypothetical protein